MVSSECSNEYWFVVEKCLVKFHHISLPTARKKIQNLKKRLAEGKTSNDLIYHVEPFELACDIGKQDLCLDEYWSEYEKVLESYTPRQTKASPSEPKKKAAESNLLSISDYSSGRYGTGTRGLEKKAVAKKAAAKKAAAKKAAGAQKKPAKKAAAGAKKKTTRK
jgi:hypothetical protein